MVCRKIGWENQIIKSCVSVNPCLVALVITDSTFNHFNKNNQEILKNKHDTEIFLILKNSLNFKVWSTELQSLRNTYLNDRRSLIYYLWVKLNAKSSLHMIQTFQMNRKIQLFNKVKWTRLSNFVKSCQKPHIKSVSSVHAMIVVTWMLHVGRGRG